MITINVIYVTVMLRSIRVYCCNGLPLAFTGYEIGVFNIDIGAIVPTLAGIEWTDVFQLFMFVVNSIFDILGIYELNKKTVQSTFKMTTFKVEPVAVLITHTCGTVKY